MAWTLSPLVYHQADGSKEKTGIVEFHGTELTTREGGTIVTSWRKTTKSPYIESSCSMRQGTKSGYDMRKDHKSARLTAEEPPQHPRLSADRLEVNARRRQVDGQARLNLRQLRYW